MHVMSTNGMGGGVISTHCGFALVNSVKTKTSVGMPYQTKIMLSCPFHALAYEIERALQADKLVHPILKRGHSNAVEASHNVLFRLRSKDIFLERLHYHLSTNLGLLQANLTYMHAKFGTSYQWIPELYRRLKLPGYRKH